MERALFTMVPRQPSRLDREKLQQMNQVVDKAQTTLLKNASLFATGVLGGDRKNLMFLYAGGAFLIVAAAMLLTATLGMRTMLVVPIVLFGGVLGSFLGWRRPARRALEPGGTALRDQVLGFRRYVATAEANQLDFEAEQDIYRRYLPWAVLFGLTERWTQVCQQLAEAGRIPALDTSFWIGARSAAAMADDMSSLHQPLRSAATAASPSSSSSSGFFSGGGSGGILRLLRRLLRWWGWRWDERQQLAI